MIRQLDSDTVLFVLGDHGMTATGDHGGDSFDELDATLFIYSSSVISDDIPSQVCRLLQCPTLFTLSTIQYSTIKF